DQTTVFAAVLGAGFVAGCTGRLHAGGWPNVLMFWSTPACAAVGIMGSRLETWLRTRGRTTLAVLTTWPLVLAQFVLFAYNPFRLVPDAERAKFAREFEQQIRDLQIDGEVLVWGRGHLTHPRHFHMAAFFDVLRTDGRIPQQIVEAFRARRFT